MFYKAHVDSVLMTALNGSNAVTTAVLHIHDGIDEPKDFCNQKLN